ncbi:MAG: hypothetical protein RLZZ385_875 [Pseudomonadota bacterium]
MAFEPPAIPQALLSFFLPAPLREPVMGDLQEEYAERRDVARNRGAVDLWYWRQAIHTACTFLWTQRGAGMAYLLSLIFFVLMLVLALATADFGLWLISPPVLILLVPTSLALGIGATSAQAARLAFRLSLSDADPASPKLVDLARRFLQVTGNQFLLVGGVAFFLGLILLLIGFSQNPELLDSSTLYARYGIALLPLFYGMIFKCVFYSAEQKILWRYARD